jgi:hypothetical protein
MRCGSALRILRRASSFASADCQKPCCSRAAVARSKPSRAGPWGECAAGAPPPRQVLVLSLNSRPREDYAIPLQVDFGTLRHGQAGVVAEIAPPPRTQEADFERQAFPGSLGKDQHQTWLVGRVGNLIALDHAPLAAPGAQGRRGCSPARIEDFQVGSRSRTPRRWNAPAPLNRSALPAAAATHLRFFCPRHRRPIAGTLRQADGGRCKKGPPKGRPVNPAIALPPVRRFRRGRGFAAVPCSPMQHRWPLTTGPSLRPRSPHCWPERRRSWERCGGHQQSRYRRLQPARSPADGNQRID